MLCVRVGLVGPAGEGPQAGGALVVMTDLNRIKKVSTRVHVEGRVHLTALRLLNLHHRS